MTTVMRWQHSFRSPINSRGVLLASMSVSFFTECGYSDCFSLQWYKSEYDDSIINLVRRLRALPRMF